MSHVHDGPLATYNSLTDSHLAGYFANGRMRRHLHKAGLVSRRGEIVSESVYRLNMSRREHKRHVKDMLAQAIVHKTLDMERFHQAEIKQKLEEIAKLQMVRRVRDERTRLYEEACLPLLSPKSNRTRTPSPRRLRSHRSSKSRGLNSASSSRQGKRDRASSNRKGDEDILPILTPRSSGQSPSPSPRGRGRRSKQQLGSDVPGVRGRRRRQSDASFEEEGDVLYLDDEGRPITPGAMGSDRHHPEQSNLDSRHLHSLDTAALRKYAQLMSVLEEGRGMASPYMMPQVPLPPRPPSSARTPRSARRVQSASPRRNITTDSRLARLHRPETAKSHAGDQQTLCQVSMRYHGWALHLARERTDHTQEVTIEQQHCGGNTLTVFKERLEPGSKFEFISYRHRGYPFSLSLYVDGQMDSRVSTCCEYRHSRGAKIGGKQGHFSLLRVSGAVPCYKCQVAKGVRVPTRASPRRLKRPAEVRREEVIVVSTKGDRSQEKEDRGERKVSEPVEDFSDDGGDVVMIPVEGDEHDDSEHNESDTKLRNAQTDDYADDFEDSQASETSKSTDDSSTSSSESESETPKEEENKKKMTKKGRQEEEFFRRKEDRGEEEEEEAERSITLRGREQQKEQQQQQQQQEQRERDRPPSVRSPRAQPRVMVNSTGRGIDDYSSDEDEEAVEMTKVTPYERTKVVAVDDIDADSNRPIRSHRRSGSSSSSTASSSDDQTQQKSRGQGGSPIINVDLLDKEEKKAEEGRRERERREELRRKEEKVTLQRQETENEQRMEARKKAEEARRQEDLYRHQQKDEERRQREEERRQGAERERQRREEEEETRRRQVQIEEDPDTRERRRLVSQKSRDEQIRKEQEEREEKRRREEEERATAWKLEEAKRERKIKMEAEERERRRVEEGYSSARSETSTARSTAASSSAVSSSAETTPRHVPANKGLNTQDDDSAEVTRAASPLPAAAVYEDRRRVREPQEKAYAPPRPTSPLPAAAQYEDRRRLREPQEKTTSLRPTSPLPQAAQYVDRRQERQREAPAARPVSPLPRAAVYEDRKRSRRAEEEEEEEEEERVRSSETKTTSSAPVPAIQLQTGEASEDPPHTGRSSTSDVSSTATSDDDFSDDRRSIEGVDEARQYGLGGGHQGRGH